MGSAPNHDARGRYSRGDVVDAALAMLDELGLPDLSMRRLADTLGVRPSALYWHVASKQELLALVADRILGAMREPASHADWRFAARVEAEALRDGLLAYRDGAEVVLSTLALGLGARGAHERLVAAVAPSGAPSQAVLAAANALLHLALGTALLTQQRMHADALGAAAAGVALGSDDADREAATFGASVEIVIDGVERARADAARC